MNKTDVVMKAMSEMSQVKMSIMGSPYRFKGSSIDIYETAVSVRHVADKLFDLNCMMIDQHLRTIERINGHLANILNEIY